MRSKELEGAFWGESNVHPPLHPRATFKPRHMKDSTVCTKANLAEKLRTEPFGALTQVFLELKSLSMKCPAKMTYS